MLINKSGKIQYDNRSSRCHLVGELPITNGTCVTNSVKPKRIGYLVTFDYHQALVYKMYTYDSWVKAMFRDELIEIAECELDPMAGTIVRYTTY